MNDEERLLIAAVDRLAAWNDGDTEATEPSYTHDALDLQRDLRAVLDYARGFLHEETIKTLMDHIVVLNANIATRIAEVERLRATRLPSVDPAEQDEDIDEALSDAISNGEGRLVVRCVKSALATRGYKIVPILPDPHDYERDPVNQPQNM